jgi:hypothetical protein
MCGICRCRVCRVQVCVRGSRDQELLLRMSLIAEGAIGDACFGHVCREGDRLSEETSVPSLQLLVHRWEGDRASSLRDSGHCGPPLWSDVVANVEWRWEKGPLPILPWALYRQGRVQRREGNASSSFRVSGHWWFLCFSYRSTGGKESELRLPFALAGTEVRHCGVMWWPTSSGVGRKGRLPKSP